MKILLLEDDIILSDILKEYLEEMSYLVYRTYTGDETEDALYSERFDLLLFDINVPNINGLKLLEDFRNLGFKTPIIFMTASTDFIEFEKAYELGANDFIRKPFKLEELKIRIEYINKTILKYSKEIIKVNEKVKFDLFNMCLIKDNNKITLPKKEAEIIKYFILNKDRIVSTDELVINLWEYTKEPSISTIRTYIKNIRKNINNISTIKGLGYMLKTN